jgi:conjugal transfer pilus assembly protein TraV
MSNIRVNYKLITILLISFLSGCSILPYETKFACESNLNLGKCVSVEEAYDEAVNGVSHGENITQDGETPKKKASVKNRNPSPKQYRYQSVAKVEVVEPLQPQETPYQSYQSKMLNKLSGMIKQTDTPLVRPAQQIRTLILSYSLDGDKQRLYMPRMVYSIEKEAQFVMGQYSLKNDPELMNLEGFLGGSK